MGVGGVTHGGFAWVGLELELGEASRDEVRDPEGVESVSILDFLFLRLCCFDSDSWYLQD